MTETAVREVADYQLDFVDLGNPFVSIFGAKGSGKTYIGTLFAMTMAIEGGQGLIMLNTLQQARDIFKQNIEPFLKEMAWPYTFNEQQMILRIWDSTIHMRSAEKDVVKRIESIEYEWGWADEVSYYHPDAVKTFLSRIRKGRALKRITSMPDEPDAFIYQYLDSRDDCKIHEVSLADNPDPAFRERYTKELALTYSGAQLDRFLHGKRVSLQGMGIFHVMPEMQAEHPYNPAEPLLLSWDFNVAYRAVTGWQIVGKDESARPIVACVFARQMIEATVHEDAAKLAQDLRAHKSELIITGDASGANRTALATGSMWTAVKEAFGKTLQIPVSYRIPSSNPLVRDTIECCNWALKQGLVRFDRDRAKAAYNSMSAAKADKYGDIDKKDDYKDGTVKSHDADTARYALWHYYQRDYPGTNKRYWIN